MDGFERSEPDPDPVVSMADSVPVSRHCPYPSGSIRCTISPLRPLADQMNEAEIRKLVVERIARTKTGRTATFLSEMFIDSFSRRADLVVANGTLSAFEIKSRRDSLDRLKGQVETYTKLFEHVTVVCTENHLAGVESIVTDDIGIWVVDSKGKFSLFRRSRRRAVDKLGWLSFLPIDEMRALMRLHSLPTSGLKEDLISRGAGIPLRTVRQYAIDYLKRRHFRVGRLIEQRRAITVTNAKQELRPVPVEQLAETRAIPRRKLHSPSSG